MKHVPNIISMSRIVLLLILFFTFGHTYLFLILYLICGLSDVLDGYIARKTKTQSELGARLDSIADFLLFAVITVSVIVWMGNRCLMYLPLIIIAAVIRLANVIIAAGKYHTFAMLHTWGNKFTGLLIFVTPLFILYQRAESLWIVCIIAVVSAAEETVIHISSASLDINRRSIFF